MIHEVLIGLSGLILGYSFGVLGFFASLITIYDYRVASRVNKTEVFPVSLRRSIHYRTYVDALKRLHAQIEEQRDRPDTVVGIHYGGVASAADIAAQFYVPLHLMSTQFKSIDGKAVCQRVIPSYRRPDIKGKHVLLVDNRIWSGRTMHMAREQLLADGAVSVRTLVVFKPKTATGHADIVLFQGLARFKNVLR